MVGDALVAIDAGFARLECLLMAPRGDALLLLEVHVLEFVAVAAFARVRSFIDLQTRSAMLRRSASNFSLVPIVPAILWYSSLVA